MGSPPLTWRTLDLMYLSIWAWGITSTYVENTEFWLYPVQELKDHLHLRGEHPFRKVSKVGVKGSPPLTWRTLGICQSCLCELRITSTYVENTAMSKRPTLDIQDHLHLRGEHSFLELSVGTRVGSPPLTWRTLVVCIALATALRITPPLTWRTLIIQADEKGISGITSTYVENTKRSL